MKQGIEKKHSVDVMFLMVVFLVFTFSAVTVFLLAVNFYRSTVEKSDKNASARIAVAYVREVLRQNDVENGIEITEFDGIPCIKVQQSEEYILYLYLDEEELKELYAIEGAEMTASDGEPIMALKSFSFEETQDGVFVIECEDFFENKEQVVVSGKSVGGGQS